MSRRHRTLPIALTLAALLAGCATHVEVAGQFPTPVTRRLPVSVTLVMEPEFRAYRFAVTEPREVSLAVGGPQADLFRTVAGAMFRELNSAEALAPPATTELILMPRVEEVQIATPAETQLKIFEVWVRYRLYLYDAAGNAIADWPLAAYGKTPSRVLESDGDALNQATIMALRDAGAALITGFTRTPGVAAWLAAHDALPAGEQVAP
ncbi:MAG TPA: hypothetical protein VFV18_04650 [Porticoccaceae bacterium]|nr:hypothetical protein [Porticoccaceae bacterium]